MDNQWEDVRVVVIRLDGEPANPSAMDPEELKWRKIISKKMPYLCFFQATGKLKGQQYYANGFTSSGALSNMDDAAGVLMKGPWAKDYFGDAALLARCAKEYEDRKRRQI